jgi:DNA-binding protein HU-beta
MATTDDKQQATRKDLTRALADKMAVTLSQADHIVDNFLAVIEEMIKKQDLQLVGLGSFKQVTRAARQGRNPKTGEPVAIPERTVVKFKPSKAIRDAFRKSRKPKPAVRKPAPSPAKTTKAASRTNKR